MQVSIEGKGDVCLPSEGSNDAMGNLLPRVLWVSESRRVHYSK